MRRRGCLRSLVEGASGEATQCKNGVIGLSLEPWFPDTETISL